jgi:hypothetical protein
MSYYKFTPRMSLLGVPFLLAVSCLAQIASPPDGFQRQIQQMQEEAARNEQQLHAYQWIESTTMTINGSSRPPKQSICRYAPNGALSKAPLGTPSQPPKVGGGPLRRMMAEKKIEEFEKETEQIHVLTAMYLPLNHAHFQEALHTHRVDFERNGPSGNAIVIHDYAKLGDELRLVLNTSTMHLQRIVVKSYFEKPQNVFTANVDFASLQDGTSYPGITTIDAPSMKIAISTVESNFSRPTY